MNSKKLEVSFAGLELKNPIIAASCSMTGSAKQNQTLAEAGVGAIVLKSLFEEDIVRESAALADAMMHVEGGDYIHAYAASNALNEYLTLIKESRKLCDTTPIIASINCHASGEWCDYARAVEQAGADGLELNVMTINSDVMGADGDLERLHIAIAKSVCEAVSIPVIMKLGTMMSNHVSLVSRLAACGVKGFVMFNRDYQTDIDIDTMSYTRGKVLSSAESIATPLRYIAITSAAVPETTLALSGGASSGEDIIKSLLAGASAVEVCSALYRAGADLKGWVEATLSQIEQWQEAKGYNSVGEYCGTMNNRSEEYRDEVMRSQFLKFFGTYK